MSAVCTEWARRHGAVRLAAPDRPRAVFTAARARGETPSPVRVDGWGELERAWWALVWPKGA